MKKLMSLIITVLVVAVIGLSVAVFSLYQKSNTVQTSTSTASTQLENNETEISSESENTDTESEVTGLQCSVQLGALEIVEGDEFSISELNNSDYEAYIENNTYIVVGSKTHDNHIVVTVPKDYQFQSVTLTVTGGALSAQGIETQALYTNCDKGSINFSGSINGNAQIQHQQGKTILNINANQSDFNYELDYDLGHIGIGAKQYAGASGKETINNGASKTMNIQCKMGSVSVVFS